jgi:peptidoglycan/xylan/chitin deacetylase (PgdA/CDA1 family)
MKPLVVFVLLASSVAACASTAETGAGAGSVRLSELYDADLGVLKAGDPDWNEVCLTIDDGPNPLTTPRLLEILSEKGIKATFFLIGERARKYPDLVKRIVEGGHELGNHTMTHARLARSSRQEILNEIERARSAIEGTAGLRIRLFRPPGGGLSEDVYSVAKELGLTTVLWTQVSKDYEATPPAKIVTSALEHAESGSILVMHDGRPETLAALPAIIEALRLKGLSFVPAGRWAERYRMRSERS